MNNFVVVVLAKSDYFVQNTNHLHTYITMGTVGKKYIHTYIGTYIGMLVEKQHIGEPQSSGGRRVERRSDRYNRKLDSSCSFRPSIGIRPVHPRHNYLQK